MSSSVPTGYVEKGPFEMVPHWVLEHPEISGNAVRLYAVLCRYGNKDRPSWPARHTLAKKMNVSPSTVDRARHELVTIGALCFINRKTDEGDWTSNLYHIHWDRVIDCRYLTGGRGLPYTGDVYAPMGDGPPPAGDGLPPVMNETDLPEPDLSEPDLRKDRPSDDRILTSTFGALWNIWPKRSRRTESLRALKEALRTVDYLTIIESGRRYVQWQRSTDEYPVSLINWIRDERWTDEYPGTPEPEPYDPDAPTCEHGSVQGRCALCRWQGAA